VIDEMALAYRTWRVQVIEAIFQPAEADPLKNFSDALRFRKE